MLLFLLIWTFFFSKVWLNFINCFWYYSLETVSPGFYTRLHQANLRKQHCLLSEVIRLYGWYDRLVKADIIFFFWNFRNAIIFYHWWRFDTKMSFFYTWRVAFCNFFSSLPDFLQSVHRTPVLPPLKSYLMVLQTMEASRTGQDRPWPVL